MSILLTTLEVKYATRYGQYQRYARKGKALKAQVVQAELQRINHAIVDLKMQQSVHRGRSRGYDRLWATALVA